jgi:hypothetical protein
MNFQLSIFKAQGIFKFQVSIAPSTALNWRDELASPVAFADSQTRPSIINFPQMKIDY